MSTYNNKLRTIIVVDDNCYAAKFELMSKDLSLDIIGVYKSYREGLDFILKEAPELIIVDVHIPGDKDGISLAKEVNGLPIHTIITTALEDQDLFDRTTKLNNCHFLAKPINKNSLSSIINDIVEVSSKSNSYESEIYQDSSHNINSILIKKASQYIKVDKDEIIYASANGDYVTIKTSNQKFINKLSLSTLEKMLDRGFFFRCHRAHIVNLNFLKNISTMNNSLNFGEVDIPLSRNRKKALLEQFNRIS